jgi:hypothetical protein
MYYKLVDLTLKSPFVEEDLNPGLPIQYKIGEFVKAHDITLAKNIGLFVYTDMETATEAARPLGSYVRLFEVEVKGPLDTKSAYSPTDVSLDHFYGKKMLLLNNTMTVTAVKLVREIVLQ